MPFIKKINTDSKGKKVFDKPKVIQGLDGLNGKDGYTPTKDELLKLIKPLIPKSIKGEKGSKGDKGDVGKGKDGENGIHGKDGSPDPPEIIIEKINTTRESIELEVVKGLNKRLQGIQQSNTPIPSSQRIRMKINGVEQNEPMGSLNVVGTASHTGQDYTINIGAGSSPLTTKGDIYTYDTTNNRLPVGTDGQVLSADSSQSTGLKWITNSSGTASRYRLVQALVAGDNTITHNLGNSQIIVSVRDDTTGDDINVRVLSETANSCIINVVSAVLLARITII